MTYLKQVVVEFFKDDCTTLAAALSYYTVFALPPLLYLLLTVVTAGLSVAYDSQEAEEKAQDALEQQTAQLVGDLSAADAINDMIRRSRHDPDSWWKTAISVVGVLIAVTGLMGALQRSLNRVWQVRPDPDRSAVRYLFRKRLVSFLLVIGLGALLLASILVSGVIAYLGAQMKTLTGIEGAPAAAINYGVQTLVALVAFAAVFRVLPDVRVAWRDVAVGALITTALFFAGRIAMQQYFAFSSPAGRVSEAAASLAAIFIWVYYSSMILLLGAEATQVFAQRGGRAARLKSRAVHVVEQIERA
ncbi:hypothetical protein Pla108_31360 [Botrimarina colliarenosi]|uniref:Uncharacterized protein n=1 Tax=Botrimarina colliarenosi TaxID=2528001 RepID=A0A5C6A7Y0_9BACT|nr:YihY/virulence factor BrkB family protein [Botrimarina colliarenosi]TWT96054.1 hypothetical protein Pla108_31360 [Botrimarina colliarenosi]